MSEEPKPRRRIRKRWVVLAILIAIPIAIRVALPFALETAVKSYLTDQGMTVSTSPNISFQLLQGRASIENLVADHASGKSLAIGHVHIDVAWKPFTQRQIIVEAVDIGAVESSIELDSEGSIFLSGIEVPLSEPPPPAENPWYYEIQSLDVAGSRIGVKIEDYEAVIGIEQLGLEHLGNLAPEKSALVDFIVSLNDTPISFGGKATPFHVQRGGTTHVTVEALDIAPFAPWLTAAGIYDAAGQLSLDLELDGTFHQETEVIEFKSTGSVNVDDFALHHSDFDAPSVSLDWNGEVSANGTLGALVLAIAGKLNVEPIRATLPKSDIALDVAGLTYDGSVNIDPNATESLLVSGTLGLIGGSVYIGKDDAIQTVSYNDLQLAVAPFAREESGAFRSNGTLATKTITFLDPTAALDVQTENLDVAFDLQATGGDLAALTTTSTVTIGEANAAIGSDEETMLAHVADLKLQADNLETPLTSAASYLRSTSTLSIGTARAENAGGFDATTENIVFDGTLDVGGDATVLGNVEVGTTTFVNRADAALNGTLASLAVAGLGVYADNHVGAQSISLVDFNALDTIAPINKEFPKSISIGSLAITEMAANSNSVEADTVDVSNLGLTIQRRKDGALAHAASPPAEGETPAEATPIETVPETTEESGDAFAVVVNRFSLTGDNAVRFSDAAVEPTVRITAAPLNFTASDINTTKGAGPTTFNIDIGIGKQGTIKADGTMTLDPTKPTGQATATIRSVDLNPFDPYTQRYIGYRLNTGKLDYDADIELDAGAIDATTKLALLNFTVERLATDEKDELTEQLGLPVNTAISLLRDSDDAIRLNIPITGDLTKPSFGIGDAIRKATLNAMKGGVTAVFAPIGMVIGAANNVKFDPILFSKGSDELSPDAIEQLAKVAELLKKRPKVKLRLCGISTGAELKAAGVVPPIIPLDAPDAELLLTPPTAMAKEIAETAPEVMPGDDGLLELATARSQAVITYLVDDQGIDPARLFDCAPRIETESGAKPRVAVSL